MKEKYYGQFVQYQNGIWIGRKFTFENFLEEQFLRKKAEEAILKKKIAVHISEFLRNNVQNPTKFKGDFILDFDGESNKEQDINELKKEVLKLTDYLIEKEIVFYAVFSGNRGFKIVIPYEYFVQYSNLPYLYKNIAINLKEHLKLSHLDAQIYDPSHIMRLTNTVHEKSGLFQIPITDDELYNLNAFELKKLATNQRFIQAKKVEYTFNPFIEFIDKSYEQIQKHDISKVINLETLPQCIYKMLNKGFQEGKRHNALLRIASFLTIAKEDPSVVYEWNKKNVPELPAREIEATLKGLTNRQYRFGCNDELLSEYCPYKKRIMCEYYRKEKLKWLQQK